jgi:hypothetical protein
MRVLRVIFGTLVISQRNVAVEFIAGLSKKTIR